jgi:hypothetical protein
MRLAMNVLYRLMLLHLFVEFPLMSPRELMVSVCAWLSFFLLVDGKLLHINANTINQQKERQPGAYRYHQLTWTHERETSKQV